MAATMATVIEEQCFLCDPYLGVISRTINECSAADYSGVE
jgi:hypothetical protein